MPNPHFDPRALRDISGEDADFERELVTDYLRDAERLLGAQRSALEAGDVRTAEREAHSLKGASLTLGARPLGLLAQDIERLARDRRVEQALGHLDRAVREFEAVRVELEQHLRRLAA